MHRTFTALALALSLGITSPSSLLDPLWARLSSLWHGTEAGCTMDPNGRCLPAPQPRSQQKAGCGMDPNGCMPALTDYADEGCTMDPNGRCKPGS